MSNWIMPDKVDDIENGAKFFRADLHIHTPASLDFQRKNVTPKQIVAKAIESKLDLVAITDHNTIDNCYSVIEAARDSNLVVLPGIEISTQGGKFR